MKPSREEVVVAAKEAGFLLHTFAMDDLPSILTPSGDNVLTERLERFAAAIAEATAKPLNERIKFLDLMDRTQIRNIGLLEGRLSAERAVSDRLLIALDRLTDALDATYWSSWQSTGRFSVQLEEAKEVIAEVEAMRKEQE